jgi:lipopolysaccharide export system permease protein
LFDKYRTKWDAGQLGEVPGSQRLLELSFLAPPKVKEQGSFVVIFNRSLVREFSQTSLYVAVSLLAILLTLSLVKLLGLAAGGALATDAVLAMLGFGALTYLPVVLSASVFIAILMTLSRAWRDSEMVVWFSSGVSIFQFARPVLRFAVPLSILVALLSLFISPWALQQRGVYQKQLDSRDDVSLVSPGVFRESKNSDQVFFVDSMSEREGRVSNVFVQTVQGDKLSITVAAQGFVRTAKNGDRFMVLNKGRRYEGTPGQPNYNMVDFDSAELRIEQRTVRGTDLSTKGQSVADILRSPNPENIAELHWRIGLPVSFLLLALLAIPLSYVNTRSGRGANLLLAILAYMLYYNTMSIAQAWTVSGRLPLVVGIWPVHLLFFLVFLVFLNARTGFFSRLRIKA